MAMISEFSASLEVKKITAIKTNKGLNRLEIIAMFSTGMSFKRMMRPYMISAAIISVVTFGLGAYVIPKRCV